MLKTCPVTIAFLAAACSPASVSDQGSEPVAQLSADERAVPVASLADIAGFWYIASFENFEPGWRTSGAWRASFVFIDDDHLSYAIGCNRSGNAAKIDNGILKDTGGGNRMQTLMGCPAEIQDRDGRLFNFFSANLKVSRLGQGKLRITDGSTDLILLDPGRYLAERGAGLSEVAGRWVPQYAEQYSGWGMSGSSIGEAAGVMTISANRMNWSECSRAEVRGRHTGRHRFLKNGEPAGDCPLDNLQLGAAGNIITRIMRSDPGFVRVQEDKIVMFTDDEALFLVSEESMLHPNPASPAPNAPPPPPPPPSPPPLPAG
ncbi:hypothetical protein [Altererythrobacter aquiaggeris]|uniref:hypothetical protein n=1 Tax=Aestuarierythrobacter aquiaggeris TaxID=1898396 RepID=UPI0030197781